MTAGKWMMQFGNKILAIRNQIIDLIFPKNCVNCGRSDTWLCDECQSKIRPNIMSQCLVCKKIQADNGICQKCQPFSALDGLWIMTDYDNKLIENIIRLIKYKYIAELVDYLGPLMESYFGGKSKLEKDFILIPVPLHRRRFLTRGFNQAELIARELSDQYGNEIVDDLIFRRHYNQPQTNLGAHLRVSNVKGIFKINQKVADQLKDKLVVLVDDVYTTGSTMQECARVLKHGGIKNVWGLAIARGNSS